VYLKIQCFSHTLTANIINYCVNPVLGGDKLHIPDGFLDLPIAAVFYILSVIAVGYSAYKARNELDETKVPLVGVVAAAIFAAQMLNWPIPGGTSAHFVAGALAGILLGPYLGCLAMTAVLVVQCLAFGDGGITALGANVFSMAVVDVYAGYYIYKALSSKNTSLAAFVAGWLGITLAAITIGIAVGLSESFAYGITTTVTVMGVWHCILGIIEGVITSAVVSYVAASRPDILYTARGVAQ